jgi:predicted ester cyclase
MNMSPDRVMRTWFEEVWNQGREETIDRLFAADAVAHGLPGAPMRGPEAFKQLFNTFRGAFADIHIDVLRTVTEGEMIAVHCHVTGTHTGRELGVDATQRRVEFEGVTIGRVVNGQIHEGWNCFDFLTMYQQLEMLPALPGA